MMTREKAEELLDALAAEMGVADLGEGGRLFALAEMAGVSEEAILGAREMTPKEVREEYFRGIWCHIGALVKADGDLRKSLISLAFGMFTTLEGAGTFCFCDVIPSPHPHNRLYQRLRGDNWYPQGGEHILGGESHHVFRGMDPEENLAEKELAEREREQLEEKAKRSEFRYAMKKAMELLGSEASSETLGEKALALLETWKKDRETDLEKEKRIEQRQRP